LSRNARRLSRHVHGLSRHRCNLTVLLFQVEKACYRSDITFTSSVKRPSGHPPTSSSFERRAPGGGDGSVVVD